MTYLFVTVIRREAPAVTNTEQRPGRHRAPSAVAGVIAAAAGGTAIPELLGVFANVAQVALIPTGKDYFLTGCIVVGLLGMFALFDPGRDGYRDSVIRVVVTASAVVLCGIAAVRPRPVDGAWSGAVHLGSANGTEPRYTYAGCLYRIDRTFAADLKALGDDRLNQGLEAIPTKGTAVELACRTLVWNRP